MRSLERKIGAICRAVAVKVAEGQKVPKAEGVTASEEQGGVTASEEQGGVTASEEQGGKESPQEHAHYFTSYLLRYLFTLSNPRSMNSEGHGAIINRLPMHSFFHNLFIEMIVLDKKNKTESE